MVTPAVVADLALRHAEILRGATFHEPLFSSGVSNVEVVPTGRKAPVEEGMATGGPRGAGAPPAASESHQSRPARRATMHSWRTTRDWLSASGS